MVDIDNTYTVLQNVQLCRPEWADKISIVNCRWVYDCITQWTVVPAGDASSRYSQLHAVALIACSFLPEDMHILPSPSRICDAWCLRASTLHDSFVKRAGVQLLEYLACLNIKVVFQAKTR